MQKILFLSLILSTTICQAETYKGETSKSNKTESSSQSAVAGCAPPAGSAILDLNNVRTIIHTGGDAWGDLVGNALYEVPKGSGKHALFSGSLWMGGKESGSGNLKLAAMRFRQDGNDFWPGPLTTDGAASIGAQTCAEYDKFFSITKAEVELFAAWWECNQDPNCDAAVEFPNYGIPYSILNWPGNGDLSQGQEQHLAPFFDRDGNDYYDPIGEGDYPYYDINEEINCKTDRTSHLYGDKTLWWVFNDKGNIHTETGADAIGMEIHGQAFAFATNDEVNDMTFYNYELINRSSYKLEETYFAQWVDADLGDPTDDYVGCDVPRGLGYAYNGFAVDGTGGPGHYGPQPPAIGVDFFEGPYQDSNMVDDAVGIYANQALNGLGYGDSIPDNERFGMRRFVYHNNDASAQGDPQTGPEHYNYMRGIWRDNTPMVYGGNGHINNCTSCEPAHFMFPGDSDLDDYWGTNGNPVAKWTEETALNTAGDRRFMQSAGPFTLKPGAVNNITVGIVYARATNGGPMASVEKLRLVDDKAQSLFENCFEVLDGPDAPELSIIEMDKELILTLSNCATSNNANEDYEEVDPFIITPSTDSVPYDNTYRFQGYQIFQVKSASVSVSDLHNPDLARLVAQTDIKDSVGQIINYYYNDELVGSIPVEEVNGSDEGIKHSFQIQYDQFATGDRRLINHHTYHYLAIAYAYNNYKTYVQDVQPIGQKKPYLSGRKTCTGGSIESVSAIPHIVSPQDQGTAVNAAYGDGPQLKRVEGTGNGGVALNFTEATEESILNSSENRIEQPTYLGRGGPIDIKVFNPLQVPNADFTFKILDSITPGDLSDAYWSLKNESSGEVVYATHNLSVINEQLIEEWGLSLTVKQQEEPGGYVANGGILEATMSFSSDDNLWLSAVEDADGASAFNWIRAGSVISSTDNSYDYPKYNSNNPNFEFYDPNQYFEKLINRTWSPYKLASEEDNVGAPSFGRHQYNEWEDLASVDLVITSDKSQWTRCPVIEMGENSLVSIGGAQKFDLRQSPSVGKDGKPDNSGTKGMSWFPGYAINLETGERLNLMFGEDSWMVRDNGADMIWNPSERKIDELLNPIFGGKHYIYIMGHNGSGTSDCPLYDQGEWIFQQLSDDNYHPGISKRISVYRNAMWVNLPLLEEGEELLSSDVRIRLRVSKPYKSQLAADWLNPNPQNDNLPMYTFSTGDLQTVNDDLPTAKEALPLVNVVPNPYYGYSYYENNQLDNRVKITNVPEDCIISIYTVSGHLIRKYVKSDPKTSLDWDLKNHAGIPIASGVYIIHVDAGEVGQKTLKWFGSLRPIDLSSF